MRVNTNVVIFLMTFFNEFLVFILPILKFKVTKSDASVKDSFFRTIKKKIHDLSVQQKQTEGKLY